MKILLIAAAVLAGLVIVAYVLVALLFPREKVISIIESRASEALGMPVHVGDAGISFVGIPALQVTDLIIGPPAGATDTLAVVPSIRVRVNLLKLLARRVEIVSVAIRRPAITIAGAPADSAAAVSGVLHAQPDSAKSSSTPAMPMLPLPVTMRSFTIREGMVTLANPADSSRIIIGPIDQNLSLAIERDLGSIQSSGHIDIEDIRMVKASGDSLGGYHVTFDHVLTGSPIQGALSLDTGALTINGLKLAVTAGVTDWYKCRFSAESGAIDAGAALALIPAMMLPNRDRITTGGSFSFSVNGTANLATKPPALTWSGALTLDSMRMNYQGFTKGIDNLSAKIQFTEKNIAIDALSLAAGTSKVSVSGTVASYLDTASVDLKIAGSLLLDDLAAAFPLPPDMAASGGITLDLTVAGAPAIPSTFSATGSASLRNLTLALPKLLYNPAKITGGLAFTPAAATLENLVVISGNSDFTINGRLAGYQHLLAPKQGGSATLTGAIASKLIDINKLVIMPKEIVIIMPWELEPVIRQAPIPPNLVVDTSLSLGTIVFGRLTADRMTGKVTLKDGLLGLNNLTVAAYDGALNGTAKLDLGAPEKATYSLDGSLKNLDAGAFLAALFGVERFMRGTFSSTMALSGSGLDSLSMVTNLLGKGSMRFEKGEIDNWLFTKLLGEKLSFLDFDAIRFDTITNTFTIRDGRVSTPDMAVAGKTLSIRLDGSAGFDKTIDYLITFRLDQARAKRALESIPALSSLSSSSLTTLDLGVKTTGTFSKPSFAVDTDGVRRQIGTELKTRAVDKAQDLLEKSIKDSSLKEEGKRILNRIFR